jgi:preprotein translocase subunit SecE
VFGASPLGRRALAFILDSRIELRKVVWPTRQETLQTTLMVFIFVAAAGLFFWVLDLVLAWATRALTGQGG